MKLLLIIILIVVSIGVLIFLALKSSDKDDLETIVSGAENGGGLSNASSQLKEWFSRMAEDRSVLTVVFMIVFGVGLFIAILYLILTKTVHPF